MIPAMISKPCAGVVKLCVAFEYKISVRVPGRFAAVATSRPNVITLLVVTDVADESM